MSQPEDTLPDPLGKWSTDLVAEVVTPLAARQASGMAAAAAGAARVAGISTTAVVAGHVAAKVVGAVMLGATIAGAVAAATGILPDPIQSWVADLVDGIGIHLPRPDEIVPSIPTTLTVPDVSLPGISVPVVTLP